MNELARRVRARVDPAVDIARVAPSFGAGFVPIRHRCPDVRRLAEWTGYEPRVSLDQTVAAAVTARRAARSLS